jgi:outer membrane receptor for Fe3+-dicitrate
VDENYLQDQLLRLRNQGYVKAFGYDVFGNKRDKTDDVNDGPRHPTSYAFYLEDQITTKNLQINLGLRYDSFASDERIFPDPTNPDLTDGWSSFANILPQAMVKSSSHKYLLPRLGALFFINDRLKLNFVWGKYAEQVRFSDVYASRTYYLRYLPGGYFNNAPRGLDVRPVESTQTEVGVSYQIQPHFNINASLFHKLIEGQLETDRIVADWESSISNFTFLANNGETIAKGFELSLQYKNGGISSWLNYALSDVRGFNSYPTSNLAEVDRGLYYSNEDEVQAQQMSPLDYNQRHRVNALLSYEFDRTTSNWLAGTGAHLLFRFNSGHNFALYYGGLG